MKTYAGWSGGPDLAQPRPERRRFNLSMKMSRQELERQAGILGRSLKAQEIRENARIITTSSHHGTNFSSLLWRDQVQLRDTITGELVDTLISGKNSETWAKQFNDLLRHNIANKSFSARRIAVTEAGFAQVEAQRFSYDMTSSAMTSTRSYASRRRAAFARSTTMRSTAL